MSAHSYNPLPRESEKIVVLELVSRGRPEVSDLIPEPLDRPRRKASLRVLECSHDVVGTFLLLA
jgi:hypothetical protein